MTGITKNSDYTVTIEGYGSTGVGVARIDGRAVFVPGALRGERCVIKILKVTGRAVYAKLVELITPSPHRIAPECPVFGKCGGCDLMHMDYGEELEFKRTRVLDALRRIGGLDIADIGITGAPDIRGYRNKAIYAVGREGGHAVTGFYRERSHDIVQCERCIIQAEFSDKAARAVRRWMDRYRIPHYDGNRGVRHVFCRYAFKTGQAQVAIVTAGGESHLPELVREILLDCPETAGIALCVNKSRGNTVLAGELRTIWGSDYIEDELCGFRFRLSPRSFYQINSTQAERLYDKAVRLALPDGGDALDLYCGAGTITLALSRKARHVTGAEIVPDAITDAIENARVSGVTNAEFILADASLAAERIKKSGARPDAVVVDPPRKGLAPDVIAAIADIAPRRVVYVSCDPATLARDLRLFVERGYGVSEVSAFDMFPRCAHVETVALLSKLKSTKSFEVKIDLDEIGKQGNL